MFTEKKSHEWLEKNYSDLYSWIKNSFQDLTEAAIDKIEYSPDDSGYGNHSLLLTILTNKNEFHISIHKTTKRDKKGYIGLTYVDRLDRRGRDLEEASYSQGGWEHILDDLLYTDGISFDDLLEMLKKRSS